MPPSMKRLAILTSGGDSPGMNAAIRSVVRTALGRGLEVFGIRNGYDGLIDGDISPMKSVDVGGIIGRGGTILRSGRSPRFMEPEGRAAAAKTLKANAIEWLVVLGGDGSLTGAKLLHEEQGVAVIGLPGSIDNDIPCTDLSIGFDTAVNTAVEAIDKIRDTAYSHDRVFVIEVMGRRNGFIALEAGLAGGAEAILIPELPFDLPGICDMLRAGVAKGKRSSIIVTAEGAATASSVQEYLQRETGYEVRCLVLGHMQRGGSPTALDRVLATRMGAEAVKVAMAGSDCHTIGLVGTKLVAEHLSVVLSTQRNVDPERLLLAEVMAL
jgi:6-phosphofructokinase 1